MTELGRRMRRSYLGALWLLGMAACAVFWLYVVVEQRKESLDAITGLAVDQQVIMQRVSLMAVMLAHPEPLAGSATLRRDISADLRQLQANHRALKAAAGLSVDEDGVGVAQPSVPGRVFLAPPHRLDDRLASFIADARRVLAAPLGTVRPEIVDPIAAAARDELPKALDAAVGAFRAEIMAFVKLRSQIKIALLGGWLLLLVALSVGVFRPLVRAVEDRTEALEAARQQMEHTALHDQLTGLANRRYLSEYLERTLARARRHDEVTAVLHLDLDRFKQINDTLGHAAGDAVLVEAVKRMNNTLRESDFLARVGGDEFLFVAPEVKSADGLSAMAERIIEALCEPIDYDGRKCYIGASIGIALAAPNSDISIERLIMNADAALYDAKGSGRGCHRFFGDDAALPLRREALAEPRPLRAVGA
ncbi:MAG: GGDEF domain-containing protein [Pseudomonadota bacterium]